MKTILLLLISIILNTSILANDFVNFFNKVNSFTADFVQQNNNITTRGTLSFNRPSSILWHTKKPDEHIVLLHNNKITIYDVWLATANIIDYKTNNLIEYFITKPENLSQIPQFIATKDNINYYKADKIYFGFKTGMLAEIITINKLDQEIYVRLNNLKTNINIQDKFKIVLPEDVDIMQE